MTNSDEKTIIRTPKTGDRPYFATARQTAQDRRLSAEARGVLWYLLSKPDDWKIIPADLEAEFDLGRDKVKTILRDLRAHRYIVTETIRDPVTHRFTGKVDRVYEIPAVLDFRPAESHTHGNPPLHITEGQEGQGNNVNLKEMPGEDWNLPFPAPQGYSIDKPVPAEWLTEERKKYAGELARRICEEAGLQPVALPQREKGWLWDACQRLTAISMPLDYAARLYRYTAEKKRGTNWNFSLLPAMYTEWLRFYRDEIIAASGDQDQLDEMREATAGNGMPLHVDYPEELL